MNQEKSLGAPKDYLLGLRENWKADALSGFFVFLIALPLSLGIAKASEFPSVMGLLTAIIGGLLLTFISGSHLAIKGPAAGLIVIMAEAVTEFGGGESGWHLALGTVVISGVFLVLFGVLRLGSLSEFFPSSVIHGMLAAIGLVVFSKQIHVLLGIDPKELSGMEPLELYAHIPHSLLHADLKIALVGVVSLLIVFGLPFVNNRYVKRIPSPVIVLAVAIPMAALMDFKETLPPFSLVKVGNFIEAIQINVDFSGWQQTGTFIKYVVLLTLIGGIESLLTVKAIDGLDPHKRKSKYDLDLIAIGLGNIISGTFGGLPVISEVARSSANVNNGGITRWSNFFHGLFLLISVVTVPFFIEMIPNAALAALLIGVGYRLASPKEFRRTYAIGPEQLIIFITTIFFTLSVDLLVGVLAGVAMKMIIEWMNGTRPGSMFKIKAIVEQKLNNHYEIKIASPATFSNLISFKKQFDVIPKTAKVVVDFTNCGLADHTFMETLHHYESEFADNGGHLNLIGFDQYHYFSDHPLAVRKYFNNPSNQRRVRALSKRQKELSEYALANGLEFEPRITSKVISLSLAPFALTRKTKKMENLMVGSNPQFNFFYADVYMEEGAYLTAMGKSLTILYISNIKKELPDFTLDNESLLDILGLTTKNDIDFSSHSTFSKKYLLSGPDEVKIRKLFDEDLITFLESSEDIYIECANNTLLIHSNSRLLEVSQMGNYRKLTRQLMALLLR